MPFPIGSPLTDRRHNSNIALCVASRGNKSVHRLLLLLLLLLLLTNRLTWRLVQKLQGHVTYQKEI